MIYSVRRRSIQPHGLHRDSVYQHTLEGGQTIASGCLPGGHRWLGCVAYSSPLRRLFARSVAVPTHGPQRRSHLVPVSTHAIVGYGEGVRTVEWLDGRALRGPFPRHRWIEIAHMDC